MIKSIVSLFAIYVTLSSGSRRLILQAGGPPMALPPMGGPPMALPPMGGPPMALPPVPGTGAGSQGLPPPPAAVLPPPAAAPQPPQPPQAPQAPQPPQPPAAPGLPPQMGQQQPPQPPMGQLPLPWAQPPMGGPPAPPMGQPAIGGGAATPPGPPAWVPPKLPPMNSHQVQTTMECTLMNTNPAGCAGRLTTMKNAGENFALKCNNIGSCAAATMTFNYVNSFTQRVEQISFSEQYAGYGATVIMDSTQSARKQYIDKFECKAPGACLNTNVKLIGGASLNDVDCPYPHFCQNCMIEVCEYGPMGQLLCGTPKPCFGY